MAYLQQVKLAAMTEQLGGTTVADTQVTNLDEKVLDRQTKHSRRYYIVPTSNPPSFEVGERSYLELREPMAARLLELQTPGHSRLLTKKNNGVRGTLLGRMRFRD